MRFRCKTKMSGAPDKQKQHSERLEKILREQLKANEDTLLLLADK